MSHLALTFGGNCKYVLFMPPQRKITTLSCWHNLLIYCYKFTHRQVTIFTPSKSTYNTIGKCALEATVIGCTTETLFVLHICLWKCLTMTGSSSSVIYGAPTMDTVTKGLLTLNFCRQYQRNDLQ